MNKVKTSRKRNEHLGLVWMVLLVDSFAGFTADASSQCLEIGEKVRVHTRETCPTDRLPGSVTGDGHRVHIGPNQSEPSIVVKGSTVLVGFTDERGIDCPDLYNFRNWSSSSDAGRSFMEGTRFPHSDELGGRAWMALGSDDSVYFSGLYPARVPHTRGISVLAGKIVSPGTVEWRYDTIIYTKDLRMTFEKDAIVVDQVSKIVYGFFNAVRSDRNPFQRPATPVGLAMVRSLEGDAFEDQPYIVARAANNVVNPKGAFPIVAPNGELYVAWKTGEYLDPTNEIHFSGSADHGQHFDDMTVAVSCPFQNSPNPQDITPVYPQMAIDPARGTLYLAWQTACPASQLVRTRGDIVVSHFTPHRDIGWSEPVVVFDDSPHLPHFIPTLTVDGNGHLLVFAYRRLQPTGDLMAQLTMAQSIDGGRTFGRQIPLTEPFSQDRIYGSLGNYISSASVGNDSWVAFMDTTAGDADVYVTKVSSTCHRNE